MISTLLYIITFLYFIYAMSISKLENILLSKTWFSVLVRWEIITELAEGMIIVAMATKGVAIWKLQNLNMTNIVSCLNIVILWYVCTTHMHATHTRIKEEVLVMQWQRARDETRWKTGGNLHDEKTLQLFTDVGLLNLTEGMWNSYPIEAAPQFSKDE